MFGVSPKTAPLKLNSLKSQKPILINSTKLVEYQTKSSESEDLTQSDSHLQQFHESLHLNIINSDN